MSQLDNPNPVVYEVPEYTARPRKSTLSDDTEDEIDAWEVFDHIRRINDPEHPNTLEQLKVATYEGIKVDDKSSYCQVSFTPTIPHCSMATLSMFECQRSGVLY